MCFFHFFTFEFNIFNDEILETKHLHLPNGLQLTSQTFLFFVLWKIDFPKLFFFKIVFFIFFLVEYRIFKRKMLEINHSRFRKGSELISQNAHFPSVQFCMMKILLPFQIYWFVFELHKVLSTIKISLIEILSFAKMKFFRFNLYAIVFFILRNWWATRWQLPLWSDKWWRQKVWLDVER